MKQPRPMTEQERLEHGRIIAQLALEIDNAEDARKEAAKEAKEEIDKLRARLSHLCTELRTGVVMEEQQVDLFGETVTQLSQMREGAERE